MSNTQKPTLKQMKSRRITVNGKEFKIRKAGRSENWHYGIRFKLVNIDGSALLNLENSDYETLKAMNAYILREDIPLEKFALKLRVIGWKWDTDAYGQPIEETV